MAMDKGDAGCTSGLSKRIYIAWTGSADSGFSGLTTAQEKMVKALCYSIASSVVDEITTNARVDVTVHAAHDDALQLDPATGLETLAPKLDHTLTNGVVY